MRPPTGSLPDPVQSSIDTVFTGLRETQPSPDFECRLRGTLASPSALPAYPGRRSLPLALALPSLLRTRAALALAAALVFSLSLAFFHSHHPSAPSAPATLLSANRSANSSSPPTPASPAIKGLCCHSERSAQLAHFSLIHGAKPRQPSAPTASAVNVPAASYPAPPMPLTDQEKLLLRVAEAQNPQQSAVLNPKLQATAEAARTEEFQLFFVAATTVPHDQSTN